MKKAREVIANASRGFNSEYQSAEDHADDVIQDLMKAGFVILPHEPDEGMIDAADKALIDPASDGVDTMSLILPTYHAMLSNYKSRQEGEK